MSNYVLQVDEMYMHTQVQLMQSVAGVEVHHGALQRWICLNGMVSRFVPKSWI